MGHQFVELGLESSLGVRRIPFYKFNATIQPGVQFIAKGPLAGSEVKITDSAYSDLITLNGKAEAFVQGGSPLVIEACGRFPYRKWIGVEFVGKILGGSGIHWPSSQSNDQDVYHISEADARQIDGGILGFIARLDPSYMDRFNHWFIEAASNRPFYVVE